MVLVRSWQAAAAALLTLTTVACTGSEEPAPGDDPATSLGGFVAEVTEPSHLAPGSNCLESECVQILSLVNDPLVSADADTGELIFDGLAASIESDQGHTVWTIRLRPGREFHNGEPVDARSFQRAWAYAQDPANAQAAAELMARIAGAGDDAELSGLDVVDDLTLRVTLAEGFAQFSQMLSHPTAFAPIAETCLADLEACQQQPVGTGPYRMAGPWQHDESITLARWSDYAGQRPANAEGVTFKMYSSPTAAYRDFRNGGLDVLTLAPEVYLEAEADLGEAIIEEPTTQLTLMAFPVDRPPFDDPRVRQAISMSIDRRLIVDQVLGGLADPSTDLIPPPVPGSDEGACGYCVHDPVRARALLREADVDLEDETIAYHYNADAGHDAWVEAAARQVQEHLGLDYTLRSTPWAQYLEMIEGGAFQGPFRYGWNQVYPSPANYLDPLVGSRADLTGYSDPEVDALIAEGDDASSVAAGLPSYRRAADAVLEDLPVMPMWSGRTAIVHSDDLDDVRYDPVLGTVAYREVTIVD